MPASSDVSRAGTGFPGPLSDGFVSTVLGALPGRLNDSLEAVGGRLGSLPSVGDRLLGVSTPYIPLLGCVYRCFRYIGRSRHKNYTASGQSLEQSVRMSAVTNGRQAIESRVFRRRDRACRPVGATQQHRSQLWRVSDGPELCSDGGHGRRYGADDSGATARVSGLPDPVTGPGRTPSVSRAAPFGGESGPDGGGRQSPVEMSDTLPTAAVRIHRTGKTGHEPSGGRGRLLTEHEQTIIARYTATENTVTYSDATGDSQPEQAYRGENQ
jgi:hypothetical protein